MQISPWELKELGAELKQSLWIWDFQQIKHNFTHWTMVCRKHLHQVETSFQGNSVSWAQKLNRMFLFFSRYLCAWAVSPGLETCALHFYQTMFPDSWQRLIFLQLRGAVQKIFWANLGFCPNRLDPPPTVAQNRGSWGHFRFWPYSSFFLIWKSSVRLG